MKLALSLAALLIPALTFAQNQIAFLPEPDFELAVGRGLASVRPADAFAVTPECAVVDGRFLQPLPIEQAAKLLDGCLSAMAARYGGADLVARHGTVTREGSITAQVEVLKIMIPRSLSQASALVRDINHGLKTRGSKLLGHAVVVERLDDRRVTASNETPAQSAVDGCLLTGVVRKIESGADFIKYYGGCLAQSPRLRVVDMRQSAARKLGVVLLSDADRSVVDAMSGPLKVVAANGPVEIDLLAYANPVYRP